MVNEKEIRKMAEEEINKEALKCSKCIHNCGWCKEHDDKYELLLIKKASHQAREKILNELLERVKKSRNDCNVRNIYAREAYADIQNEIEELKKGDKK